MKRDMDDGVLSCLANPEHECATEARNVLREATPAHFVGNDQKLREVWDLVTQIADTEATVLITGESGTGKDLIARALHEKSSRARAVYCGQLWSHRRDPAGIRVVRPCQRRLYRGHYPKSG